MESVYKTAVSLSRQEVVDRIFQSGVFKVERAEDAGVFGQEYTQSQMALYAYRVDDSNLIFSWQAGMAGPEGILSRVKLVERDGGCILYAEFSIGVFPMWAPFVYMPFGFLLGCAFYLSGKTLPGVLLLVSVPVAFIYWVVKYLETRLILKKIGKALDLDVVWKRISVWEETGYWR